MVEDEADKEEEEVEELAVGRRGLEPGKSDWPYGSGKPPVSMLAMPGLSRKGGSEVDGRADEEEEDEEEVAEVDARAEELVRGPFPVAPRPTASGPEDTKGGGGNMECRSPSASPNWDLFPVPPPPSRG